MSDIENQNNKKPRKLTRRQMERIIQDKIDDEACKFDRRLVLGLVIAWLILIFLVQID